MNKVIKEMAVINQLNELSVNDVKVRSSEMTRLPANIKAKITAKLYKIPLPRIVMNEPKQVGKGILYSLAVIFALMFAGSLVISLLLTFTVFMHGSPAD